MMNPLLENFNTPHNTPPFDLIMIEHYEEAFKKALDNTRSEIEAIASSLSVPDFNNTIEALEEAGEKLDEVSAIFFNLNSACTSKSMQATAQQISPLLTEFSNSVYMNQRLFEKVEEVYCNRSAFVLSPEQNTLLENTRKAFIKGGANLKGRDKEEFRVISVDLSRLKLQFEENMLAETHAFELLLTDRNDLGGLPESAIEGAAMAARDKGKEGWLFTLNAPSYIPFLKYAENRGLREQMYRAYSSRCNHNNQQDNKEIIRKMTALRCKKAQLLGFASYADYVLADRMAETADSVKEFLYQLLDASHPFALKERQEVAVFARSLGFNEELQRWDWAYYSNKLKQVKYALDDEMLKPYFKLENVQKGVFSLANMLYGLAFEEVQNIPKYHEEVKTFEVRDQDGSFLAILYIDFFPRPNKNNGAWMTEYRTQHVKNGRDIRPLVSLVMNFTKPTSGTPSLLTFDEVSTFLHEFGHALHGMLSRNLYSSVAGTNVLRDFVELPSQLMENWALEKEWLDQWAVHYQTGEKIPEEYITKIKNAANFQSGYFCDRQLSFGITDMAWHSISSAITGSIEGFEKISMQATESFPFVEGSCFSTAFGHIFGGGYAAGYYSYKWAEVLDADAYSAFKENGIFDKATAESFRKNILEKGGSEHPMVLYVRFRRHKPNVSALLERSGLLKA